MSAPGGDAEEGVDPERSLAWLAEDEGGRVGGEAGPVRDPRHRLGKDASLVVGEEGRVEGFRHVCDVDRELAEPSDERWELDSCRGSARVWLVVRIVKKVGAQLLRCDGRLADGKEEGEEGDREDGEGGGVERDREENRVHSFDAILGSFPYSDRAHEVEDERDVDRHREEIVGRRSVRSAPELEDQEDDSNELPTQELEELAWSDECEEANQWLSEPIKELEDVAWTHECEEANQWSSEPISANH